MIIAAAQKASRKRRTYAAIIAVSIGVLAAFLVPAFTYAGSSEPPQTDVCGSSSGAAECNHFVTTYINPAIMTLTVLVGVVAIISFIVSGIQYASSTDDPGIVTKAKQRMFNTVLGLILYIFLFALMNYLIPGDFL